MTDWARVVKEAPQLARGIVWCQSCGRQMSVRSDACIAVGWPKCCGHTMTLDSPEERGEGGASMRLVDEIEAAAKRFRAATEREK